MRKYFKALVNIAAAAVLFLAAVILLPRAVVFFAPFVTGWIISLAAGPPVRFIEEKVKLRRRAGSAFVIIVIIGLVVLPVYLIALKLAEQAAGLIESLPEIWKGMEGDLEDIGAALSALADKLPGETAFQPEGLLEQLKTTLGDFVGRLSTPAITAAGNFARQLPAFFIGMIMTLLSAYFFVAEREQINAWFRVHTPVSLQMRYRTVRHSLTHSVGGYFKAQLKIEIWMYLLLLAGLGALRVGYFALIALGIAILDFLPFLGTGTVLIPWALSRILLADYRMAVWLLIIWAGGQLARQLIQPKIVGDSVGLSPLPTLFLLFIGYKTGGILGMIIAVPVGLLLHSLYQEGAFETTVNSVRILAAGLNRFRRLDREDLREAEEMKAASRKMPGEKK